MIRVYLQSLAVGLAAAFVAGAIWVGLGATGVTTSSRFSAPAQAELAKPNEAIPASASSDIRVETKDDLVAMHTTTYADPYVGWVALAAMVLASGWNLRRLRKAW